MSHCFLHYFHTKSNKIDLTPNPKHTYMKENMDIFQEMTTWLMYSQPYLLLFAHEIL